MLSSHTRANVSIHAPLTGGDGGRLRGQWVMGVSIHAPLTGGDDDGGSYEF